MIILLVKDYSELMLLADRATSHRLRRASLKNPILARSVLEELVLVGRLIEHQFWLVDLSRDHEVVDETALLAADAVQV